MKRTAVYCFVLLLLSSVQGYAADKPTAKLKGLWCTGGCCHDYKKHAPLLTEKIGQYASVDFEIVFGLDVFKKPDYAKDYDVVVYDLCYAKEEDKDLIGNITKTVCQGKPTVIVHCSLHTFRAIDWDDWRQVMGMTSKSHDRFRAIKTKVATAHPITAFWPADWEAPGDELYQTIKLWPSAKPLLTVFSVQSEKDHTVCWINEYGKGRVFATTLGHNMQVVGLDEYHRLLANGLLWSCKKLDEDGEPAKGFEGTKAE